MGQRIGWVLRLNCYVIFVKNLGGSVIAFFFFSTTILENFQNSRGHGPPGPWLRHWLNAKYICVVDKITSLSTI